MQNTPTESDALKTWFSRQRRDWWRINWWKWAVLVVVVIVGVAFAFAYPYQQASLLAQQHGMSISQVLPQMSKVYYISLPLGYLILLLFSIWQISYLGRSYHVPSELLVASTHKDCTRAYQRIFRRDVYLVFGLLILIPEMLFLQFFSVTTEQSWQVAGFMLYLILAQLSLSEIVVVLHSFKRDMRPFIYFIVPTVLMLASLLAPSAAILIVDSLLGLDLEEQTGVVALFMGMILLVFAFDLGRIPLVRAAMNSVWVER